LEEVVIPSKWQGQIAEVVCGNYHVVIRTFDGEVYSWGLNEPADKIVKNSMPKALNSNGKFKNTTRCNKIFATDNFSIFLTNNSNNQLSA